MQLQRQLIYVQHITNDTHAPHVRIVSDGIKVNDFGRSKLAGTEEHLQFRVVVAGQAKVNDFNAVAGLCETQDILGLQVQVQNILAVNKRYSLANLLHEYRARLLRQRELVINYALKQLTAIDTEIQLNKNS